MDKHIIPEFTIVNAIGAIAIAFIYTIISSIPNEPNRQKISAVIIAGAGGVYWSGGSRIAEYIFATVILWLSKDFQTIRILALHG